MKPIPIGGLELQIIKEEFTDLLILDLEGKTREEAKAVEVLQQAYQMAKEIRDGADKYADEVLANLEATSTRILRTLKAGRDRLTKTAATGESK